MKKKIVLLRLSLVNYKDRKYNETYISLMRGTNFIIHIKISDRSSFLSDYFVIYLIKLLA